MPTAFRNAYRHLRNQLYQAILTNLGVSFEQLRKAMLQLNDNSPSADVVAAQRNTVADLLGNLQGLLISPDCRIHLAQGLVGSSQVA